MVAMNDVPAPTTRAREGRWLGGVCAGLAARWGVPAARVRLGFALASVVLGLGVLVYLAAWLILPGEGEHGGQRGIVLLAQACGALLGLATLAAAGATATVFGYGWAVVAVAGAVLVGALTGWARLGHVEPSTSTVTLTPRRLAELPRQPLRSGLGLLTVDLRRTELPRSGRIPLKIEAGVRRTLIALPHERCVHVQVVRHEAPALLRLGAVFVGEPNLGTPGASVFGRDPSERRPASPRSGPTLAVDYSSAGGELVVRDYPDDVDPAFHPDWPGYPVYVEERPDTTGMSRAAAKTMLREWRARRKRQQRDKTRIDRLMGGPCTAKR
jgi:phage shock protein PspC (stress-responsive transcriptional regulator)